MQLSINGKDSNLKVVAGQFTFGEDHEKDDPINLSVQSTTVTVGGIETQNTLGKSFVPNEKNGVDAKGKYIVRDVNGNPVLEFNETCPAGTAFAPCDAAVTYNADNGGQTVATITETGGYTFSGHYGFKYQLSSPQDKHPLGNIEFTEEWSPNEVHGHVKIERPADK